MLEEHYNNNISLLIKLLIQVIWIIICKKSSRLIYILLTHLCRSLWLRLVLHLVFSLFLCCATFFIGQTHVLLVNCILCYKESSKKVVSFLDLYSTVPKAETQNNFLGALPHKTPINGFTVSPKSPTKAAGDWTHLDSV